MVFLLRFRLLLVNTPTQTLHITFQNEVDLRRCCFRPFRRCAVGIWIRNRRRRRGQIRIRHRNGQWRHLCDLQCHFDSKCRHFGSLHPRPRRSCYPSFGRSCRWRWYRIRRWLWANWIPNWLWATLLWIQHLLQEVSTVWWHVFECFCYRILRWIHSQWLAEPTLGEQSSSHFAYFAH